MRRAEARLLYNTRQWSQILVSNDVTKLWYAVCGLHYSFSPELQPFSDETKPVAPKAHSSETFRCL